MKRASTKKGMERRKRTRSKSATSRGLNRGRAHREGQSTLQGKDGLVSQRATTSVVSVSPPTQGHELCCNCQTELLEDSRVLFVEEEIRRIFCSETCISAYFFSEIEKLEKEYFSRVTPADFNSEEREGLAHLRWITLREPDEAWCEQKSSGDRLYTLISEFRPGDKRAWSVCICLCLRGEPSFLFLAFATRDQSLMNFFRRGEKLDWAQRDLSPSMDAQAQVTDGLAETWTEDETIRAELSQQRSEDDIAVEEFELYQGCIDVTLQNPDEVWSIVLFEEDGKKLYHFIKYFPQEDLGVWYLVIARETDDGDQIEILEAFPSRDYELVQRYRKGTQEVGNGTPSESRVIH